ncbi:MAG: retropepsin-like aspartic protease family protein [Pseudomonadota bacterium]
MALLCLLGGASAYAADVSVVGLFPGKAVLVVDGGNPRTVAVGKAIGGIRLVGVEEDRAVVEIDGKRHKLRIGEQAYSGGGASGPQMITLTADASGHFVTIGTVNGATVRFLVDTGATSIALGASDARRANIDLKNAKPGVTLTANGTAQVWRVKLNAVRVGDVVLNDVDATVMGHDMPMALLGMSFLNRMEMQRDGVTLTLRKRY